MNETSRSVRRAKFGIRLVVLVVGVGVLAVTARQGASAYRSWKAGRLIKSARAYIEKSDLRNATLCLRKAILSNPSNIDAARMMAELAADHAKEGTDVYDLGCSTGTTLIGMDETVKQNASFVGVDDSQPMLEKCRIKLTEAGFKHPYSLEVADLNDRVTINQASVVVLCLTLQFVRPINRERLVKRLGCVPEVESSLPQ